MTPEGEKSESLMREVVGAPQTNTGADRTTFTGIFSAAAHINKQSSYSERLQAKVAVLLERHLQILKKDY